MKFDYAIGNPPYQEQIQDTSDKPVYNYFINASHQIADVSELITPSRFLFNVGKTPKDWNKQMLNDEHFRVLHYEQTSKDVFPNTDIICKQRQQLEGQVFCPYKRRVLGAAE